MTHRKTEKINRDRTQRERERERDRQTDRQTDRHTDRHTDRETLFIRVSDDRRGGGRRECLLLHAYLAA